MEKRHIMNLLTQKDPDIRRRAAVELASSSEREVVRALTAALWDENKGVRDAAFRSLSIQGGSNVAHVIVDLIRDDNITTRNLAGELLLKWGKTSIPVIVPYLQSDNCDVQKFAVDILGLLGEEEEVSPILPLLDDPDDNVRLSAIEALGNIGSGRATRHLFELYMRHEMAQPIIAEALGKIGGHDVRDFLWGRLEELREDPAADPLVLFSLIEALGTAGNDSTLKMLQEIHEKFEGKMRNTIFRSILRISERLDRPIRMSEKIKEDLLESLQHDDVNGKINAVKGLAQFRSPEVTRALLLALNINEELDQILFSVIEKNEESFTIAVDLLKEGAAAGNSQLIAFIGQCTKHNRTEDVVTGKGLQNEALPERAFELVAREWEAADLMARDAIISTLFIIDYDRGFSFLETIIDETDPLLRMRIIELLGTSYEERAFALITRFLQDDDSGVREIAATTLGSRAVSSDAVHLSSELSND